MLCLFFYSLLPVREVLKKALPTAKNLFSYFFVVLLQPFFKDNKQYGKIKTLEEMPGHCPTSLRKWRIWKRPPKVC